MLHCRRTMQMQSSMAKYGSSETEIVRPVLKFFEQAYILYVIVVRSLARCAMNIKKANLFTYNYLWIIPFLFFVYFYFIFFRLCLK